MIFLNRSYQYHEKHKLIVIWQAKAACTIVNKMFYEEEGLLAEALRHSTWIHKYRQIHKRRTKETRIKGLYDDNSRFIHFVVNPYRRAVSSYIQAMKNTYIGVENNNICFVEFINKLISNNITQNMHHNKQTFFLHNTKQIEYVKMEHIKNRLPEINAKYGTNYKMQSSEHHAITTNQPDCFVGKLSWNKIQHNIPTNYCCFYNYATRKKVELLYNIDITTFGYTWNEFVNN